MLQDDRVAGHDGRENRDHRGEIRIIPGSNGEHYAHRLLSDEARKAWPERNLHVRQSLGRDGDHIARSLREPTQNFVWRVAERTAHLPRYLFSDLLGFRLHDLDGP